MLSWVQIKIMQSKIIISNGIFYIIVLSSFWYGMFTTSWTLNEVCGLWCNVRTHSTILYLFFSSLVESFSAKSNNQYRIICQWHLICENDYLTTLEWWDWWSSRRLDWILGQPVFRYDRELNDCLVCYWESKKSWQFFFP